MYSVYVGIVQIPDKPMLSMFVEITMLEPLKISHTYRRIFKERNNLLKKNSVFPVEKLKLYCYISKNKTKFETSMDRWVIVQVCICMCRLVTSVTKIVRFG